MAEWSNASDLKSEGLKGSVGSNPTLSVQCIRGGIGRRARLRSVFLYGVWVRPPPNAFAIVAQLVEHLTCNEDVSGSIPLNGSNASIAQWQSNRLLSDRF